MSPPTVRATEPVEEDYVTRVGVPTLVMTYPGYPRGSQRDFRDVGRGIHDSSTAVSLNARNSQRLNVTTHASSLCPDIPVSYTRTRSGELSLDIGISKSGQTSCPADIRATTAVVEFPDDVTIPKWVTLNQRNFKGPDDPPLRVLVRSTLGTTGVPKIIEWHEEALNSTEQRVLKTDPNLVPLATSISRDESNEHRLSIRTRGSVTCPALPSSFTVSDNGDLLIVLDSRSDAMACAEDFGMNSVVIELPGYAVIPATIDITRAQHELPDEAVRVQDAPE